ncbi:MAG: winged helix-turn-helix domain-containing protein [Chloroflexota bacterium]|nr:winged helix-turn-helix domain-containing protein [Chloroflexota bacterium]
MLIGFFSLRRAVDAATSFALSSVNPGPGADQHRCGDAAVPGDHLGAESVGQGIGAGKALALLAYLVVEPDYPRRREVLAALLWPDQPEESARHSLRQALTSVRQRLDDQAADPPHLIVSRDTVAFNATSDYQLDVATFDALLDACHDHPHRHADACAERL